MDTIEITGIRCYGYVGVFPEEQKLGQWFRVDLTLAMDLHKPGESDRLEDTLNYAEVVQRTKQIVENAKFALVEKLASAIASAMLEFEQVQQVRVRLSKPNAPIPHFRGNITIDITRP
ncbi:MAG: dihydroneopterin aldolase [Spirulinaceae cyanobacterium]